jgi:hypothetical protein
MVIIKKAVVVVKEKKIKIMKVIKKCKEMELVEFLKEE